MKLVPLNRFLSFTVVDDEDFEWACQWHWMLTWNGYVYRQECVDGRLRNIRMHREIMSAPKGVDVDHVEGNRLDNRRSNMRLCTRSQNLKNKTRRRRDNKSGVTGVFRHSDGKKWSVQIQLDGKPCHLGQFENFDEAVRVRRAAELKFYGAFAPKKAASRARSST